MHDKSNGADQDADGGGSKMQKNMGLVSGTALIVGTMIGSGIFITPKGVLEGTGSIGFSMIVWVACGLLSTLGALSYAELGTCIPRSGGEHAYLMYTFGSPNRRIGTLPAFLFDWVGLFILRPTMLTVVTLSLGTYVVKPFFPGCHEVPDFPVKLVTIATMLVLATVNIFSAKVATYLQNVTTLAKLVAIGIIAVGGIYNLARGNTDTISEGFRDTTTDPSLVSIAFFNGLWAFDGWNNLNFVTEELKDPEKNLPRSIMIGIPLTTVAYLLANIGYLAVMSKEEVLLSHAVAVAWSDYMLGPVSWLMIVFVILSCIGSGNGCLYSTGRLCFAAARDGHFPTVLSFIQKDRLTPVLSIIFTTLIAICTVIPGDLSTLIDFYCFTIYIWYSITIVSLLILRYTRPGLPRPYKVPVFIPVIFLVVSVYLTISPIIQTGRLTFLFALIFMFSGLIIYFPFIYFGVKFPFVREISRWLQKVFLVLPPRD